MQLTIRVSDDKIIKIKQIADILGLKKSDVTRMAINKFVDEFHSTGSEFGPYNKIKHLLGSAESGVNDLGQRHREHLIKKISGDNEGNS